MLAEENTQLKIFFWISCHAIRKTGNLDVGVTCVSKSLKPLYQSKRRRIKSTIIFTKGTARTSHLVLLKTTESSDPKQKFLTPKNTIFMLVINLTSSLIIYFVKGILTKDRDVKSATNLRLSRTNADKRSLLFIIL